MKRLLLAFCIMALCTIFPMRVSAEEKETELTDGFVSVGIEDNTEQNETQGAGGEESRPASDTAENSDAGSETGTGTVAMEENQPDADGAYEESSDMDTASPAWNQETNNTYDTEKIEISKGNDINVERADRTALAGGITDHMEKAESAEDELELGGQDEAGLGVRMPNAAKDESVSEKDNSLVRDSNSYVFVILCLGVVAVATIVVIKRNVKKRK